jgi:glutathione peroxidase-family protein
MDEDQRKVAPFVKEYKINYPILLPGGPSAFGQEVSALPTSFLVDRNGRIAREYVGMISETAVRADINRLLAER